MVLLLAVMDQNTQFVLNGDFIINLFEREIQVDGALIKYSGSDNVVEKIICNEVLNSPITVFVSFHYDVCILLLY